jgi:DNA processing protein
MTESDAFFIVNLISGIGPMRAKRLQERFGSLDRALVAREADLRTVQGIGQELAPKLANWESTVDFAGERRRAEELGLQVVTQADAAYPPALLEIYDPPLCLYIKGTIPEKWPRGIGVVGSRETSHYGLETAKKLGYQLAYAGVPVISGLARGIDTAAHLGALAAKGTTWAVLGCGLDKMYPPENDPLAAKIVESGGCLISELPLGTSPDKSTFPMRNRIVSGLSFGVLVIEAGRQSGALITARQALEQGRQVFAVPGRIDNPLAKGCWSSFSRRTQSPRRARCRQISRRMRKKSTPPSSWTRLPSTRSLKKPDCHPAPCLLRCSAWKCESWLSNCRVNGLFALPSRYG